MNRRDFLRQSLFGLGAASSLPLLARPGAALAQTGTRTRLVSRLGELGPLLPPDANGLRLPAGFKSRVVAVSGEIVPGTSYTWHPSPDGGAVFTHSSGEYVYVSNSETAAISGGGTGALRFDARGTVLDAYRILANTNSNCAGGPTPWNTWLSCEELPTGMVHECDPFSTAGTSSARPALGLFSHEAVTVDVFKRVLYLTEDVGDGRFYRFVPSATDWPAGAARPALLDGVLQVLRYRDLAPNQVPPAAFRVDRPQPIVWENVGSPTLPQVVVRQLATALGQPSPGTPFAGGEGVWCINRRVYFSTKGDNRIWLYDTGRETLDVIYDFATAPADQRILSGVDNLTVHRDREVLVAEDGGDMQLCVILPDLRLLPMLQASDDTGGSELTGPAFTRNGSRLYFSAQRSGRRGAAGTGVTFEVRGPFVQRVTL